MAGGAILMPSPPLRPFDMLLCQRSPTHAEVWQQGFGAAEQWERNNPCLADTLVRIVAVAGDWSGHLSYDAWHEGLVHGLYGLAEYRRWRGQRWSVSLAREASR